MTNNDILKKLRIALELKDTDIIEILRLADFEVSSPELSALFRNPENKNYRECGDQLLRRFLDGLIIQTARPEKTQAGANYSKAGGIAAVRKSYYSRFLNGLFTRAGQKCTDARRAKS